MNGMDNNFWRCDLLIYELQWIPDDVHQTVDMNSMYNDDDMYDYYPHQTVDVRCMGNQVIKTR